MADDDIPLEGLAIYLARDGFEKPGAAIKNIDRLRTFPIADGRTRLGTLYVATRASQPPRWGKFFHPQVKAADLGRVSSTAAVFHIVVDGRAFLLAFGQGRHLLERNCYEERFGLLVTLNSIGENRVRSIDKQTLDTIGRHTRVQASREATPSEFGLDIEQDLLRVITGTPVDSSLGKTLSGLDSLHTLARVNLDALPTLLSMYLGQFSKDTYKTTFPWVDHIATVKDALLKGDLDAQMLAEIAAGRTDKCWLAVPEPIEWERIAGFRYAKSSRRALVHDVSFQTFIEDSHLEAKDVTVEFLERHKIFAVNGDDGVQYAWPTYRCIYCEIERSGDTYLLSGGNWYKVSASFVDQVNKSFNAIPRRKLALPEYGDESEPAYSKRVAREDGAKYALMDSKPIQVGGGYSKVEFCDLLSQDRDLIHIKRYGGSGVLSHLFGQGLVSGRLFASDADFRKKVNALLPRSHKLADSMQRPDPRDYHVVFAVISRTKGDELALPFFSRLTARQAVQTLNGYGYKVALAKINVSEAVTKTKKFTSKKKK
jgi:uncharacterized protein (TIGR04141 family)